MDKKTQRERVEAQSDDTLNIHGMYKTGEDEEREYHAVLATKMHEGEVKLKFRYFTFDHDDPSDDTWMQNGITASRGDFLLEQLAKDLPAIGQGITTEKPAYARHDISE